MLCSGHSMYGTVSIFSMGCYSLLGDTGPLMQPMEFPSMSHESCMTHDFMSAWTLG